MSDFDRLALHDLQWDHIPPDFVNQHTVAAADAPALTRGYLSFLRRFAGYHLPPENRCLDLGAGAGNIARSFNQAGARMTASEHTDSGVALISRFNPGLPTKKINIAQFHEPGAYDLIFSREVYLFTRTNAFTDQLRVVSNIVDSLKPGGVFLLVGSDRAAPHCLDYDMLIRTFRKDPRLRRVTGRHYEFIFKRLSRFLKGPLTYRIVSLALAPVIQYKKRYQGFHRIYMIAFLKKETEK